MVLRILDQQGRYMWQSKRKLPSSPNHERENQNILYTPGPQSELAFPTYLAAATLLPFIVLPLLVTLFCLSFHNSSYSVMLSKMDYHLVADQINGPDTERLMKLDLAIRRKVILKVKLSI